VMGPKGGGSDTVVQTWLSPNLCESTEEKFC
jgi:hypothetical protein